MKIYIKRGSYKLTFKNKGKRYTVICPIASRFENGKLQAFSFMTEFKGK